MQRFAPYLLDRLIDASPASGEGVRLSLTVEQLKDTVVRDLESLLNTRRGIAVDRVDPHPHARASVLCYGLEDFSSLSMSGSNDRELICRRLEAAIVSHEPRLKRVQVALDVKTSSSQQLRFSIKALLCVSPLQEPVDFDAVLNATTQQYAVSPSRPSR